MPRVLVVWCWLLVNVVTAQTKIHPEELQIQGQVDRAIARGVESLFERQHRNGSWGLHGDFVGGRAGLGLYTLLQCGVDRKHPSVKRALAYLNAVTPNRTYATTCMILAFDAMREGNEERIESLVQKLIDWQRPRGDWSYPNGTPDLSCTQYAALGLWVAQKRGIKVDKDCWLDLLDAVDLYRGKPLMIKNELAEGTTGSTKIASAGYSYRAYRDNPNQKPTGSMTAAAIAIMEICKSGLGRHMSRGLRRQTADNTDAAMTWLAQNFSATSNPNGGHYYYYLYGVERIGALTQREQFGPHWWYIEGTKHLLAKQNKETGRWDSVTDTCFALLFLRRATRGYAPTTGGAGQVSHTFAAGDKTNKSDIRLRAAGQQPLSLWIDGFGKSLLELHSDYGLRVVSVEYLDAKGNCLASVNGNPAGTWRNETFLHREKALSRGRHQLHARVTLLSNDTLPGQVNPVAVIHSDVMEVTIRDVFEPWMLTTQADYQANLLRNNKPRIFVSSSIDEKHAEGNLIDGHDSKVWIASIDDKNPSITMSWKKSARVGSIVFAHPAQHDQELANFDDFDSLEICIGNDKDRWLNIPANTDRLATTYYQLPKSRKMRQIKIRFAGRTHRNGKIGLAEFALLPPSKDDPRKR